MRSPREMPCARVAGQKIRPATAEVFKMEPDYPKLDDMYFNVGVSFYKEKRYNEAKNEWQTCLKINSGNYLAINAMDVITKEGH